VPMVVMPLMTLGFGGASATLVKSALEQVPEVMVLGGEHSPKVQAALAADKRIKLVPAGADFAARISNKSLRAAVELPGDFDERIERANESVLLKIYYYQGEMRSGFGADAIERAIRD